MLVDSVTGEKGSQRVRLLGTVEQTRLDRTPHKLELTACMPVARATEETQAHLPVQPSKGYHTSLGSFKSTNSVEIVEESWPL